MMTSDDDALSKILPISKCDFSSLQVLTGNISHPQKRVHTAWDSRFSAEIMISLKRFLIENLNQSDGER